MAGEEEFVHGLFVPPAGVEPPEVEWICVRRFEAGGVVTAPRTYSAEEIADGEALVRLFGGGDYELIAMAGPAHAREETGRVRMSFYGESKGLGAGPAPGSGAGGGGALGGSNVAAIVGAVGAVLAPVVAGMMQASASRDAMMLQVLAGKGSDVKELLPLLLQTRGGGLGLADVKQILALVKGDDSASGTLLEKGVLGFVEGLGKAVAMTNEVRGLPPGGSGAGAPLDGPPAGYVEVAPGVWVPRGTQVVTGPTEKGQDVSGRPNGGDVLPFGKSSGGG